ncbi:MAG: M13 family metallopeptidase [Terriglobia bacterium]
MHLPRWLALGSLGVLVAVAPASTLSRRRSLGGSRATPVQPALSVLPPSGAAAPVSAGVNVYDIDPKAAPCTDFYQYADGRWLASNPIPPAYPEWGQFNELAERNRIILRQILEKDVADKAAPPGSNERKLGGFYASCMNTKVVDAEGMKPLGPEFRRIAAIRDTAGLESEIAHLQTMGADAVFEFGSEQDFKNSQMEIGDAEQGGLGLPNRDYYTKQDSKSKEIRDEYVAHVAKMFELLGDKPRAAGQEAQTVMGIETRLARASMTPAAMRDPKAVYHKMDPGRLKMLTPDFSWDSYFRETGYPEIGAINIGQPDFFRTMNQEITSLPLADWKTYLRWHLIHASAKYLSKPFVDENFNFYGRTLEGTQQILPRWKRCVAASDNAMGMALGKEYVQKAFPPQAKARALKMVGNLIAALRDDVSTLDWMGPSTRQQALAKLQVVMKKIGYPVKWRDYSALRIAHGPYVDNVFRAEAFEFHRDLNKIGKPVDRTEWEMTPPTVNAYYDPSMNEIVFPAGILQPPFFNAKADDASNYGAMGAVIGHELTHGFDDEGRQFNAQGNLIDWWTPKDLKRFEARAACIVKQFDSYSVGQGLHENGKLVEGESIADLGGMTIAYAAFQRTAEAKAHVKTAGFTPDQRFFLSFAQIWAANVRPQFARLLVSTDPHPIPRLRVIGPLSNTPAFARAFNCKAGDAMVRPPAERCKIW